MKNFSDFLRRNKLFGVLLAAELVVLVSLIANLFGAPFKLALTPTDFTNDHTEIAELDDDGLRVWDQTESAAVATPTAVTSPLPGRFGD